MNRRNFPIRSASATPLSIFEPAKLRSVFLALVGFSMLLSVTLADARPHPQPASDKKKQLQNKYNQLINDIKEIEQNLQQTSNKKNQTLLQLQSLNAKISAREQLLTNIRDQVTELEHEIQGLGADVSVKSHDLQVMKQEYSQMLLHTYQTMDQGSELAYILGASSISQAYERYVYLKKYGEYRSRQASNLGQHITDLNTKITSVQAAKAEQTEMMNKQEEQQGVLLKEKASQKQLIAQLSKDEEKLKKEVAKKNQEARQLNNEIQRIIEKEIEEARLRAEAKRKADAKKTGTVKTPEKDKTQPKKSDDELSLTPAEAALSKDFVSNRSRLPWPVEKGQIVSHFGRHPHPAVADVMVENNGVDIRTTANARVRCVFEGTVISVFFMPFNQNSIIVKHGEYFTVYSNLKNVDVKINNKLATKQAIGVAYTNDTEGQTTVHMEIWKGKTKLDPELWLAGN